MAYTIRLRTVVFARLSTACAVAAVLAGGFSNASAADAEVPPERRVHAFYYPWYANPATDGAYGHWNHGVAVRGGPPKQFSGGDDIGANFFPQLGCYSSNSASDVDRHMKELRRAKAGVIAVSWWGRGSFTDKALPLLFTSAQKYGIAITFHIEPHIAPGGRTASTTREAIRYLLDRYGAHPALYRDRGRQNRPLFYVYDSYLTKASEWATILAPHGDSTIRGTKYDAVMIGLWVKQREERFMLDGHFDGFYTYFATDGFTYGSTPKNWPRLAAWAKKNGKLFIPCVGPGYIDTRIRPWNGRNTRGREDGAYYDRMFRAAIDVRAEIVGITSFNEWHEGTQIEPAIPKTVGEYRYEDYSPREPHYYLDRTAHWAGKLAPVDRPPAR